MNQVEAQERSVRSLSAGGSSGVALHFPHGLVGFPDERDYQLLESTRTGLYWLRSQVDDAPHFLLADPFRFFEGYSFDLAPPQAEELGASSSSEVGVLVITVPDPETGVWTANLQGPLVMNVARGVGAQVVLPDHSLGVRRRFRPFPDR